jgi:protein tyrosine phosphatase (PTP) superfamily phosphohydrolase (DUF442 family)
LKTAATILPDNEPLIIAEDPTPSSRPTRSSIKRYLWGSTAVTLLVIAGFALWVLLLRENLHAVIEGELYRSAQPTPAMLERVQRDLGIRTVINLRGVWVGESWFDQEVESSGELGLELHHIDMATFKLAPPDELRKLITLYESCPKPILIHCRHGADRTGLAVAIYKILYCGASLDEAMEAYSLKCGHTGYAYGRHLPHLFDIYRDWLAAEQAEHSPALFRRWVSGLESIGQFGAMVEVVDHSTVADPTLGITFRVTNTSRYPWQMETETQEGISLLVRLEDVKGDDLASAKIKAWEPVVEPGQSIEMHATIPGPRQGGQVKVRAELRDANGFRFGRFGCGTAHTQLQILPAEMLANAVSNSAPSNRK